MRPIPPQLSSKRQLVLQFSMPLPPLPFCALRLHLRLSSPLPPPSSMRQLLPPPFLMMLLPPPSSLPQLSSKRQLVLQFSMPLPPLPFCALRLHLRLSSPLPPPSSMRQLLPPPFLMMLLPPPSPLPQLSSKRQLVLQ